MRKAHFVYIIIACCLYSCVKPPTYSNIPHIEFVSVSAPNTINGFSDTITFSFTDGDGDIGVNANSGDSNSNTCGIKTGDSSTLNLQAFNVFLIDSRDSCITPYASANVQPTGKYKAISGTIQVITAVYNTKCFGGCPCAQSDSVTFAIILKDLAGHRSNTVHTSAIAVGCN